MNNSKFIMIDGEQKVFNGNDNNISTNYIMNKFNKGEIHELDIEILKLLDKFEFLTNAQITILLTINKISTPNRKKFLVKLQQLIKERMISSFSIKNKDDKFLYNVYCLDKNGRHVLVGQDFYCTWSPELNIKPLYYIKQKLAINQLMISYIKNLENFHSYEGKTTLTGKTKKDKIKLMGGIIKTFNNGILNKFIIDCVRKNETSLERFTQRLQNYEIIFDEKYKEIYPNYSLIVLAEDQKHILQIYQAIQNSSFYIPDNKLFFTTDELSTREDLKGTLINIEFDKSINEYKMSLK